MFSLRRSALFPEIRENFDRRNPLGSGRLGRGGISMRPAAVSTLTRHTESAIQNERAVGKPF
jgi:hypothetical protein